MSNDPAILFYTSDFIVGVYGWEDSQVASYIKLLCLQHQKGHFTKEFMIKQGADDVVIGKFEVDSEGLYYNQRLEDEVIKRNKFKENQRNNIAKRWNKVGNTTVIPRYSSGIAPVYTESIPLENENDTLFIKEDKSMREEESPKVIKEPVYRKFAHLAITVEDNEKLIASGYSQEQIDNTYDSIENYKKNKDYKSLYITAKKWLAKEAKQVTTEDVSEDLAYLLENERKQEERYGKHTQWYADNCK